MDKIGYLGPQGTFTEEAALSFAAGHNFMLLPSTDIPELILSVASGALDFGVVPVENALEGTVNVTVDMLVHEVDLKIVGEIVLPIHHCLLVPPGTALANIQRVLSHPQALAQCRRYLHKHLRGVPEHASTSTAAGAQQAMESGLPWGAIAHRRAAEVFGLIALDENIEDHQGNSTRFIVLAKDACRATGQDKTSIVFTVDDSPGSLLHALELFADHGINLKKIESRPMRTLLGQYLFLVDFEGHQEDNAIDAVLKLLSMGSKYYKHLGSYPRCQT